MSDEVAAPVEQKAPETSETDAPAAASSDAAPAAPADAKSGDAQPAADEKDNKPAVAASGQFLPLHFSIRTPALCFPFACASQRHKLTITFI